MIKLLRCADPPFALAWTAANAVGFAIPCALLTGLGRDDRAMLLGMLALFAVPAVCQWVVVRGRAGWARRWIPATILGGAVGVVAALTALVAASLPVALAARGEFHFVWEEQPLALAVLAGAAAAAGPAAGQWLVLRRGTRRAWAWLALGLAVGLAGALRIALTGSLSEPPLTDLVGQAIEGGIWGAAAGLVSAPVLAWVLRSRREDGAARRVVAGTWADPADEPGVVPARRGAAGWIVRAGAAGAGVLLAVALARTAAPSAFESVALALEGRPAPALEELDADGDADTGAALYHRAIWDLEHGRYRDGEAVVRRAIAIQERALGPDDPTVAGSLNMLGLLLANQNRVAEAEGAYRRALATWEAAPGGPRPARGHAHTNLGNLYQRAGDLRRAEHEYLRALDAWRAAGRAGEKPAATALSNLAALYDAMGRADEANAADERARATRERLFGPDDDEVAFTLFNQGARRIDLCDADGAERLIGRAAAIWLRSRGPEHQLTANALAALASLQDGKGEPLEFPEESRRARVFLEALLREQLPAFGPHHSDVATTYVSLGHLALAEGDLAAAERGYRGAAEAYRHGARVIGGDPAVSTLAPVLARHALVLRRLGRTDEAREVQQASDAAGPGPSCPLRSSDGLDLA